ncbi:MAG: hypothetical protein O7E51_05205 [Acidobacteria bacterium]|nr:hypothetical protein [Acidobacteriota bacterium]
MLAKEHLRDYLSTVRRRLRLEAVARGLAVCGLAALLLTVATVWLSDAWRFSDAIITFSRIVLLLGTGLVLALFLVRPLLRRLSNARIARFVEEKQPRFQDRLVTAVDLEDKLPRENSSRLFQELVAEDALAETATAPPSGLIQTSRILRPLLFAATSVAVLLLLSFFGPGFFRYGANILWMGWAQDNVQALYEWEILPGDLVVGRNTDQEVTAFPLGFHPETARFFVLYESDADWDSATMLPEEQGGGFQFLLMNIREPVQYYVESDGVRSPQFTISVTDVPRVERMEITYHYPAYTGMRDTVETEGGDIIALRGTTVTLVAYTDVPATGGQMVFDDGTSLEMKSLGERELEVTLEVSRDSLYHIRLQDHLGKQARATHEYLIQALEDSPPTLRLSRPGRDMQPNPIEEVVTEFEAEDDVRLAAMELHYFVNGGPEQTAILSQGGRNRQVTADHTLFLENFQLIPGDLVSFYGVAKDAAAHLTQTEMFFLQVRPFEKSYRQAQAGGGGGGGGGEMDNTFLSERQKEVISATWNVIRKKNQQRADAAAATEDAELLSSVQRTLKEQAETLASRVSRRLLGGVNEEFGKLVENLKKAAESMASAAGYLEKQEFREALSPEQTALQHLMRAEAMYREIQVAFGSQGGGRGGAGNSGRDLADLFDLELDTDKNQYEMLQERGRSQNNAELDDVMRKLKELARRQEQLARREPEKPKDSMRAASRWEQEMLRREAEELARRLEQLSRESNSSQMAQASRALSQAARDMQQAGSQQGSGSRSETARALERIREANDLLSGQQRQWDEQLMQRLADNADKVVRQQAKITEDIDRAAGLLGNEERVEAGLETLREVMKDKVELLESLGNIERQINAAAQRMAASQRKTAQKLRGASSMIQEERMGDKLRQGAWLARRGMWPMAATREKELQANTEQLRDRVRDAQNSLEQPGSDENLKQALRAAEQLRQELESLERQQRRSPGGSENREGQQGSQGSQGQGSQARGGQQAGEGSTGRADGSPLGGRRDSRSRAAGGAGRYRGGEEAWNRGDYRPWSPQEQRQLDRRYQQLTQQASELSRLFSEDPEFDDMVRELVGSMRNLDRGRFPGNPGELERLRAGLIDRWKELELRLSRQLQLDKSGAVRLSGLERIPERYRPILEEYYRSISRGER